MTNYPTQLDEIDQWLADNFGILPGACSSTENLRHNTARMIAEALWPKWKQSLHIPEICKENGETFTDDMDKAATKYHCAIHEVSPQWIGEIENAFKAGANWQREQFHDACYQCEKNHDNVFYRGEKHAIKMLKEEGIGGTVCGRVIDHINIRFADGVGKYLEPKDISHIPADKSKYNIGDKVKVIILKDE